MHDHSSTITLHSALAILHKPKIATYKSITWHEVTHKVQMNPVIHSDTVMLVFCVVSGPINARNCSQLCFRMTEMLDISIHCFDLFGPDRIEPSVLQFAKSQSV